MSMCAWTLFNVDCNSSQKKYFLSLKLNCNFNILYRWSFCFPSWLQERHRKNSRHYFSLYKANSYFKFSFVVFIHRHCYIHVWLKFFWFPLCSGHESDRMKYSECERRNKVWKKEAFVMNTHTRIVHFTTTKNATWTKMNSVQQKQNRKKVNDVTILSKQRKHFVLLNSIS